MNVSNDSGHFFQTSASISDAARKEAKKSNDAGSPIRLDSKLLAVISDPNREDHVYIAEAAGSVRSVNVEEGIIARSYSSPTAPLSCLALSESDSKTKSRTLYAGCWDKSIWSWDIATGKPSTRFTGHSDFVKALAFVSIQGTRLLISGSQDKSIRVWDANTGRQLHSLTGHTRGVLSLAIDPTTNTPESPAVTLFSADSLGEIRTWILRPSSWEIAPLQCRPHETSINQLLFPAPDSSDPDEPLPDLYTASSDFYARVLSREKGWAVDEGASLQHTDYVRAVYEDSKNGVVATACRDEEVRVWEKGVQQKQPVHVYSGHWEEVMGLAGCRKGGKEGVVSVGIDGTVRWWGLERAEIKRAVDEAVKAKEGNIREDEGKKESLMTEEEERELAQLMDDDD